jgi:hypothetical protein
MVHWLKGGLWFTGEKKGYGSLVEIRAMLHWSQESYSSVSYRKGFG